MDIRNLILKAGVKKKKKLAMVMGFWKKWPELFQNQYEHNEPGESLTKLQCGLLCRPGSEHGGHMLCSVRVGLTTQYLRPLPETPAQIPD